MVIEWTSARGHVGGIPCTIFSSREFFECILLHWSETARDTGNVIIFTDGVRPAAQAADIQRMYSGARTKEAEHRWKLSTSNKMVLLMPLDGHNELIIWEHFRASQT
jgi:hypothetical protein